MKKEKLSGLFLRILLSMALIVAFSVMSSPPAQSAEETINIGFLAALSGPDAGWGLPGLTGNQIFIDRVNAEGGLLEHVPYRGVRLTDSGTRRRSQYSFARHGIHVRRCPDDCARRIIPVDRPDLHELPRSSR